MKKLNILHYLFLIPFTLVCVLIFNIDSEALSVGEDATIKVNSSRIINTGCHIKSGTAATAEIISEGLVFKRYKTKITCNKSGEVTLICKSGFLNFGSNPSTITCVDETSSEPIPEEPEDPTETGEMDCEGILTADVVDLLQDVFDIIKFVDVVLVLVLTIVTFTQAIAKGGDDLKKAINITIKRVIIGVAIFFIPTLINFIFNAIGLYGTCGIG